MEGAFHKYGLSEFCNTLDSIEFIAKQVKIGKIICLFQGQSEWGPRALGNRSVVATPLLADIKEKINKAIKYREAYRPLAISGTLEGLQAVLEMNSNPLSLDYYMLSVAKIKDKKLIAFSHIDHSVRYQIVDPKVQPFYYELISTFGSLTDCHAIVNTSFNTLGEPLAETPLDALKLFLVSNADFLCIWNKYIDVSSIPSYLLEDVRIKAYKNLKINPLNAALKLEASGYIEQGYKCLKILGFTERDAMLMGQKGMRGYYAFLYRYACHINERELKLKYIKKIANIIYLPRESSIIYDYLVSSNDKKYTDVAKLVNKLMLPNHCIKLIFSLMSEKDLIV